MLSERKIRPDTIVTTVGVTKKVPEKFNLTISQVSEYTTESVALPLDIANVYSEGSTGGREAVKFLAIC